MPPSTAQIRLRPLSETDFERVLSWHNDQELYSTLGGQFRHVSPEAERNWLKQRIEARDEVNLAICMGESAEHIGNIYLRNIDWVHSNAELHIFIARPKDRGKGYGSMAVRMLVDHAFKDLGLARVYLHTLARNSAAIASYKKCGFKLEGTLRKHVFKDGAFEDMVVMGICTD
jgi:RimJ/RimL family protein N-acetyltransferase